LPFSYFDPIPYVFSLIDYYKPKSILDIGIGFGKYGVLCREILDVYHGRFNKEQWSTIIDGIEVFGQYRNSLWDVYTNIYIGDALDILSKNSNQYDLIICSDVLEHFDKIEGHRLINLCLEKAKMIIINTPRIFLGQGEVFGNIHETHRSLWKPKDLKRYNSIVLRTSDTLITAIMFRDYSLKQRLNVISIINRNNSIGKILRLSKDIYYKLHINKKSGIKDST
jgi:hypothetical protein